MQRTQISKERQEVLNRIAALEKAGEFHSPAEIDPPAKELLPNQIDYLNKKLSSRLKTRVANFIADNYFKNLIKKDILIIDGMHGEEHLEALKEGAIITCNHFSAFDNYALFHCIRKYLPRKYLYKVIREGNYTSFSGLYALFFRHCNTLPLSSNRRTMINFTLAVNTLLKRGESILVYPEQEMWWNYKKPRPFKAGAFKLAVKAGKPVVPMFITLQDDTRLDEHGYPRQRYTLWVMPPIYPNANLSDKENAEKMSNIAYEACKNTYEKVYGEPLVYGQE